MKRVFIVNPTAGNGKSLKIIKKIEEICEEENFNYDIVYTNGPGSAEEIARQHRAELGEKIVYSVGGDGTLNEVVNGIAESNTILGIIPAGTGNDFYRTLRPSGRFVRKIDVGKVNERYFINVASLGFDAKIAARANELKEKKYPSSLVYYLSIILELISLDSVKLKIDEQSKISDITLLSVCNGAYYGGGIMIAPQASINDGLFDVYEVDKIDRLQVLKLLKLLMKKQHENSDLVNHWKTDYFKVESEVPLICNVDGEIMIDNKFVFDNINDGLNIICNDHPKILSLHNQKHK